MRLISYLNDEQFQLGLIHQDAIVSLSDVAGTEFPGDLRALLFADPGLQMLGKLVRNADLDALPHLQFDQVQGILPPILRPGKVIALGRNYAAHAAESGSEPPPFPMLFHKTSTSLIGHGQPIVIPAGTERVDYEGELAIIIGRECKNVAEEDALDYVAGYTVGNDVTARDWQRRTTQFTSGKMVDTFGPLGPALVTPDEIDDVHNLNVRTYLNGEKMQDGNTGIMIFNVPFTISYISRITTLEVGDVIYTGTPEGVGFARKPPVFMQPGDEIVVEIDGIGRLANPLIAHE